MIQETALDCGNGKVLWTQSLSRSKRELGEGRVEKRKEQLYHRQQVVAAGNHEVKMSHGGRQCGQTIMSKVLTCSLYSGSNLEVREWLGTVMPVLVENGQGEL